MRSVLGWGVLIIGLVVLGFWSKTHHAASIESTIRSAALAVGTDDTQTVSIAVSGRDVTLTGAISDETEREQLLDRMSDIKGVRVIHDNLELASGT